MAVPHLPLQFRIPVDPIKWVEPTVHVGRWRRSQNLNSRAVDGKQRSQVVFAGSTSVGEVGVFRWCISNWELFRDVNSLSKFGRRSECFVAVGCCWHLVVYPQGNHCNSISVYLQAVSPEDAGWKKYVSIDFTLCAATQQNLVTKRTSHLFGATDLDWGFTRFLENDDIDDAANSYVIDGAIVIECTIVANRDRPVGAESAPVGVLVGGPNGGSQITEDDPDPEGEDQDLACPITHTWLENPVVISTGITYSLGALQQWIACQSDDKLTCPKTNKRLSATEAKEIVAGEVRRNIVAANLVTARLQAARNLLRQPKAKRDRQ